MVRAKSIRRLAPLFAVVTMWACSDPDREKVSHVEKGDRYAAEKKDDFALIEYASAVKIDRKYGAAHLKLAQTYERMGNLRSAFPAFVRAADALPDNRQVQIKATELLLIARRFDDAKGRAAALLAKNPKDVEARLLQANAMAGLGDSDGAIAQIDETLKISPGNSGAFLSLASVRLQQGQPKEAEAALRQALAADPASPGTRLALADFLIGTRRSMEAESLLRDILTKDPRHLAANRLLAGLYVGTQRIKEAEQPLKIVAEVSNNAASKFQLADYYVAAGRPKEGVVLLTQLAKDPTEFAAAEIRLATLDYSEQRAAEAHKRLDDLIRRAPKNADALALKAQWLAAEGHLDEALAQAKAAVAADPQSSAAQRALATAHDRRGETADAIRAYTEVLRAAPKAYDAQIALSRLNLVAGQRDEALRYAEEARRTAPLSGGARIALARSLMASGNAGRAETEILELLRLAPELAVAHVLKGQLDISKRNLVGARAAFDRALDISPGFPEALAGLSILDLQANAPARAIARLESGLATQPANPLLVTTIVRAYTAAGDQAKAEQVLRRAVSSDPRFTNGYAMLAQIYMKQGKIGEARAEFEGIAKRDASALGARTMVGVLLEAEGKRDEARKIYEGIVTGTGDAPVAANNLAYIYAEQGSNLDMALQLATAAKPNLPDDPNVDDTIGWVYYKKDLASLAVGPLEASAKKLPNNAEVLYHLGVTYAKLGDKTKARNTLSRAMALDAKVGGVDARRALASVSQ
jgi:tetratricopeptide (TPR) repeat protein